MEIAASVTGQPRRRGGGRFRAEIEVDSGSPSIPRGSSYGFVSAAREPLVRLKRPKFDFEIWDWSYFGWPHDRLDANLEMRDSDPDATLEADKKASETFLHRSMLLLESYAMGQDTHEQHAAAWPTKQIDGANIEMRNSEPEVTPGAGRKASEGFLNRSTLQLDGYAIGQYIEEQNAMTLPCNQHSAKQGLRDCNRKGVLEAHQKESESFLSRSTLQLKRRQTDQDQHLQKQQKNPKLRTSLLLDDKPVGCRLTRRRRGCTEANGILDHSKAMQGSWAC